MAAEELFNTYDRDGKITNRFATMSEITQDGLIFRIANIWIINEHNQIVLQKNNKPYHKGYGTWNASVTGKLSAGDTLRGGRSAN
jgi:hypothetical protein